MPFPNRDLETLPAPVLMSLAMACDLRNLAVSPLSTTPPSLTRTARSSLLWIPACFGALAA